MNAKRVVVGERNSFFDGFEGRLTEEDGAKSKRWTFDDAFRWDSIHLIPYERVWKIKLLERGCGCIMPKLGKKTYPREIIPA